MNVGLVVGMRCTGHSRQRSHAKRHVPSQATAIFQLALLLGNVTVQHRYEARPAAAAIALLPTAATF